MHRGVNKRVQAGQGQRAIVSSGPAPPADRPVNIEAASSALGWSADDDLPDSAALQEQPGVEPGAVLGREKTILIADDDPVVVAVLARRLQHLGFHVMHSPDAAFALMGAMKLHPHLVILDVEMPAGNGLAVCEMMACDRGCANIPVIIHSVFADQDVKRRCQRLGAYHVEKSPRSWTEIKSLVEVLIGENKTAQPQPTMEKPSTVPDQVALTASPPQKPPAGDCPRVLCIESPKGRLEMVDRQLSALGMAVTRTSDWEEGFWTCFTENPHAVIIHNAQSGGNLRKLLRRLVEHPVTRKLPVLLIDEGNAVAADELPSTADFKVLKHPMDWENLLDELESYLRRFRRREEPVLPRIADPSSETGVKNDRPVVAGAQSCEAASPQESLTILCIDDDPVIARSIAIRLQPYGIKVKGADNGMQGYLLGVTAQPDMVLLDLKMPNGEGNYVLGKLKENPRTKDIPIIILTMDATAGVRRQMLSLGADAFLTKPVHWPEMFAEMGRCIKLPRQLLIDYQIPEQLTLAQL